MYIEKDLITYIAAMRCLQVLPSASQGIKERAAHQALSEAELSRDDGSLDVKKRLALGDNPLDAKLEADNGPRPLGPDNQPDELEADNESSGRIRRAGRQPPQSTAETAAISAGLALLEPAQSFPNESSEYVVDCGQGKPTCDSDAHDGFVSPAVDQRSQMAATNISSGQQHQRRKPARLLSSKRTHPGDEMDSPATVPPTQIIDEISRGAERAPGMMISVTDVHQSPEQQYPGSMDAITSSIRNGQPQTLRKSQRLSAMRAACHWNKMGSSSSPSVTLPPTQAIEGQNVPVTDLSPASAFQSPEQLNPCSMDAITSSTGNGQPQTLRKSPRLSAIMRAACHWNKMGSSTPSFTLPPTQAVAEEQNVPVADLSPVSAFQSPEQQGLLVAAISADIGSGQRQQLRRSPRLAAMKGHHQEKIDTAAITGQIHAAGPGENHAVPHHQAETSMSHPEQLPITPTAAASSMATQDPGMEEKIEQVQYCHSRLIWKYSLMMVVPGCAIKAFHC